MATKQQQAVQRAVTKERKRGREREERHVLWVLLALILLLLYLFRQQYPERQLVGWSRRPA
jgi:hypothetical protein